jgi:hypothetical protein
MLAAEAQRVINLRLAALARGGPAAELETRLMVTEKMKAFGRGKYARKRGINSVGDFVLPFACAIKYAAADPQTSAAQPR